VRSEVPEERPKQFNQDQIIEILDQVNTMDPEWHEAIIYANIDIFEMSYEESVCYFKRLENLKKIKCTNGPDTHTLQVDYEKSFTNSVCKPSKNSKSSKMYCHYRDNNKANKTDFPEISKFKK
jgi:hypothetical protein